MEKLFEELILKSTAASKLSLIEEIQSLWSGYGSIVRYALEGSEIKSVVVKHVKLPKGKNHPRGWNTDLSHNRKIRSYEVETAWYSKWSKLCDSTCRVPECYAVQSFGDQVLMVFEDLDEAGYSLRKSSVSMNDVENCIKWLANFHATFINKEPEGLWQIGTYWHLDTRPEELLALDDKNLKNAAVAIDKKLNSTKYRTFVHGDAKLANFCFSKEDDVAAVDFQYVGGGCGMKDLAYFIGSCMYEEECEQYEKMLLLHYFKELKVALARRATTIDFDELKQEWTEMYYYAWTDFHRFLKGWSPGHWKINSYSEKISRKIINELAI